MAKPVPVVPEVTCGANEARMLLQASRRCRRLVRGWFAGTVAAGVSAALSFGGWFFSPSIATALLGAFSGLCTIPTIRYAISNAEDADVFELLAIRIDDQTLSPEQRELACRRVWVYIDNRLSRQ